MTQTNLKARNGAFSLVEMLVVIAVIGILAAVAVPNIGRINDAANESKNRRNAQQLSSVCNAAQAAGHDFVSGTDVSATVAAIVTGSTITDTSSPFFNTFFGVPNLSADEQDKSETYLSIANGMLIYNEDA